MKIVNEIDNILEKLSFKAYLKELGHDAKAFKKENPDGFSFFAKAYKKSSDAAEFEQNSLSDLEDEIKKIRLK